MDRLKGKRFKMGFCIECHRENERSTWAAGWHATVN
jgi:hypothetical protein